MTYDTIIIGSGPSGLTASIYTARDNLKTLVLGGSKWGGQLMLTSEVENFPGFPEGILGPNLMDLFKKQAERFGVEMRLVDVAKVDFSQRPFKIWDSDGNQFEGKSVVVATGADTVWLEVPGEQKLIGKGVSSCAPCDAFFFRGKKVIVVGGGDSAMEEAVTLAKFATEVIIVHRRSDFRASQIMQNRALSLPNVKVIWNACVAEVLGNEKVEGVKFRSIIDVEKRDKVKDLEIGISGWEKVGEEWYANFVIEGIFVAIGHSPNTKIFAGQLNLDEKGYLLKGQNMTRADQVTHDAEAAHSHYQMMTSVPGVFVAGDVHDHHYRQAVTAAAYGCQAALEVSKWLSEQS